VGRRRADRHPRLVDDDRLRGLEDAREFDRIARTRGVDRGGQVVVDLGIGVGVVAPVAQDRRGPRVRRSVRVVRRRLDDRFASVSGAGRVAPGDPAPVAATTPARTTASTTAAATNTARADPSPPIDGSRDISLPRFGSVLGRSVRSRVVRCRPVRGRDGFGVRGGLCLGNFLGGRTDLFGLSVAVAVFVTSREAISGPSRAPRRP